MLDCNINKPEVEGEVEPYLLKIDSCLLENHCLNYHQILSYKHKLNSNEEDGTLDYDTTTFVSGQAPNLVGTAYASADLDDLHLAEVNYLCIE